AVGGRLGGPWPVGPGLAEARGPELAVGARPAAVPAGTVLVQELVDPVAGPLVLPRVALQHGPQLRVPDPLGHEPDAGRPHHVVPAQLPQLGGFVLGDLGHFDDLLPVEWDGSTGIVWRRCWASMQRGGAMLAPPRALAYN